MAGTMSLAGFDGCTSEKSTSRPPMLSVLYVDDEPALLDVCKRYLERRSDISVSIADSVTNALNLLDTFPFDVIISDYQMPGTDGIGFLKILKEKHCNVPFILFTGRGREEVVIEAINNGATYYIQKGGDPKSQFAELDHKIREASRRRQAEENLHEIGLYYNTLFEHSGTAVIILDESLIIRQSNAEFSCMTGYAKSEVEGIRSWTDFVNDEDATRLKDLNRFLHTCSAPTVKQLGFHMQKKDREILSISATVSIIPATGWCIASFIDTTRLCQLEKELQERVRNPARYSCGPCPVERTRRKTHDTMITPRWIT
jgi:PAS domain S-box-containing protein